MPEKYSFGVEPITCLAWNKDKTQVALSQNDNLVHIFRKAGARWEKVTTLDEHVQRVTGIDWAANSNRIATCGADRNAYVWTLQPNGDWKPTLVILRINRAATCIKWSPLENKFAVGSGARLVSVCYFEEENDWWVSKHIKKPIRSTVLCVDWHPNNILIGCGSSDFKARVFSGYIKDIEPKPEQTNWGKKMTLGNLMAEFSNGGGGWVHSVSFSASGDKLGWVGHDSSISIVNAADNMSMVTLKTSNLPFVTCTFVAENTIISAGHDCCPMAFSYTGNSINFAGRIDASKSNTASKFSAMKMFRTLDARATTVEDNVTDLKTLHQNTINELSIFSGDKQQCSKLTSSASDGCIVTWDLSSVETSMGRLSLN